MAAGGAHEGVSVIWTISDEFGLFTFEYNHTDDSVVLLARKHHPADNPVVSASSLSDGRLAVGYKDGTIDIVDAHLNHAGFQVPPAPSALYALAELPGGIIAAAHGGGVVATPFVGKAAGQQQVLWQQDATTKVD